jgi:hypothetical protein
VCGSQVLGAVDDPPVRDPHNSSKHFQNRARQERLLAQLCSALRTRGLVRVARVIPAKLPIIKCVEAATGLQVRTLTQCMRVMHDA